MRDIRKELDPLEPLDLRRCKTVSEIVSGMSTCSFGARNLGEVAATLADWVSREEKPRIVYDGNPGTPLVELLKRLVGRGWFEKIVAPQDYSVESSGGNILVVGRYLESHEETLYGKPDQAIYINECGFVNPDYKKEGFLRDAVFTYPEYALPVLMCVLKERLDGVKSNVTDLLFYLSHYGGMPHEVARGAKNLWAMKSDPRCTKFVTIAGAMTPAQMSFVICDMIDCGMVDYIAATGALMSHGLIAGVGLKHWKHDPRFTDTELAEAKLNRVYDTLEPEENFTHIADVLDKVLTGFDGKDHISSHLLHEKIGVYLSKHYPLTRAILRSAFEQGVPMVTPAATDSEMGNDKFVHNKMREREGRPRIVLDSELDTELLVRMMLDSERAGIYRIGGGTPANNTQNAAPLIEIMVERLGLDHPEKRFFYAARISPDKVHFGGFGGATFSENESWRKIHAKGMRVEIEADATMVWPFHVKYVMEQLERTL